uniref:Endonuclease/exonuclease/phosphatase n=1 Tax=Thermocrispum agreste TaxID=37925 RepID=A0A2W4LTS3_9PSEU|nr:MAG: endonuclease/exonuclease/phosphatase [Thermocrispum agreste]
MVALSAASLVALTAIGVAVPATAATQPTQATIAEIQGITRVSPFDGKQVTGVSGIVTAIRSFGSARGFWFQDPTGDGDPRTSEGLFVFTGSATPNVRVGDAVTVSGTVKEFYPTNPSDSPFQSTTELVDASWTVTSSGNDLPEAEKITPGTVPATLTAKPGGSIEPFALRPDRYALDFWESREGMRVAVFDVPIVGPTTAYNELFVTTEPDKYRSARGGVRYTGYDADPTGVLKIESLIPFAERPFPEADTGDTLAGETSGVIEYDQFGGYTLMATELGEVEPGGLQREVTRKQRPNELAVASYNVENLDPSDDQAKFDALAKGIVENLAEPDIVTLEEVQDNNGPQGVGDGVVAADQTLNKFVDAIVAAGGPRYAWRQIDPVDLADGGEPGGNIRVAFLFNPKRVTFVDRPGGDATTPVRVVGGKKPRLSISPGRIDPNNPAFTDSRKPLAGEFRFRGKTVFVVANHFASKGGDQPVHGRFQPPARVSEEQRIEQAKAVRAFVDEIQRRDPFASIVVAGDLNDFSFSPTLRVLTKDRALTDLVEILPPEERYTYVFDGKSQVLDHILTSRGFKSVAFDIVHINAEFHDQTSDHDPAVVRLKPGGRK